MVGRPIPCTALDGVPVFLTFLPPSSSHRVHCGASSLSDFLSYGSPCTKLQLGRMDIESPSPWVVVPCAQDEVYRDIYIRQSIPTQSLRGLRRTGHHRQSVPPGLDARENHFHMTRLRSSPPAWAAKLRTRMRAYPAAIRRSARACDAGMLPASISTSQAGQSRWESSTPSTRCRSSSRASKTDSASPSQAQRVGGLLRAVDPLHQADGRDAHAPLLGDELRRSRCTCAPAGR